jgi:hypothetical protein
VIDVPIEEGDRLEGHFKVGTTHLFISLF